MACKNCVYDVLRTDSVDGAQFHWCERYLDNFAEEYQSDCAHYKPKTNGYKIRSMTDEELAEFLEGPYGNIETGKAFDWIKQIVKGE